MDAQLFRPLKPKTLKDEVVTTLRKAIVDGDLQPGQHLKEVDIAKQLSVSRSPVREAFRQLEQEGLIVSIPNQGSFVQRFDAQDIREIFSLRAALEGLACDIIIKHDLLKASDYAQLERLLKEQKKAIKARDYERLAELDIAFHEFICQKAGSERLEKMWQSLRGQMQVLFSIRFQAKQDYVSQTVSSDHTDLLKALRQGDSARCAQIYKEVNARVAKDCIQVICPPDKSA
jgi:DNA-binding GntR family transcriptional regulator